MVTGIAGPLAILAACGGQPDGADDAAPVEPAAVERRVVVADAALRVAPTADAATTIEVPGGTALALVRDTLVADGTWLELATWDDRRGWAPATEVVDEDVWLHAARALRLAPTALRPARGPAWEAEAPWPSPALRPGSGAWLAADTVVPARVGGLDTLAAECGGALRVARLAPVGGVTGPLAIVVPNRERPDVRSLPVRADGVPPALAAAVEAWSRDAAAAVAGRSEPRRTVALLGDGAAWVGLAWAGEGAAPWSAAAVVGPGPGGARPSARVVDTPAPRAGGPPSPAAALATGSGAWPIVLLLERPLERGRRAEIWIAGADDYRRLYAGHARGC